MEQLIPWWGQHRVEMTVYIVEGREEHVGSHQLTPAPEGFTLASWEISFRTCTISDLKCTRTQVQVTQGPGEQWQQKLRDLLEGGWARSRREWWCHGGQGSRWRQAHSVPSLVALLGPRVGSSPLASVSKTQVREKVPVIKGRKRLL